MYRPQYLLLLIALAAPAAAQSLRLDAESFAHAPVAIDPRLGEASCESGFRFAWANGARRAVEARCEVSGRRLVLPLAGVRRGYEGQEPRLRRGQAVQAEAQGQGFRVRVDALAEGGGLAGGSVSLRNSRTGQRFAGRMIDDGRIIVPQADAMP